MPQSLFPLINYVDLNTQQGMIAIIWKIRQAGEISYPTLYKEVFGQAIDQAEDGFRTPAVNLQQMLAFYHGLVQLYRNGIIETTKPIAEEDVLQLFQHYTRYEIDEDVVLRVSSRIAFIQHLFNISLTDIVRKGMPLKSHPIFGEPIKDFEAADVFVIIPFRNEFQTVYKQVIKPVVEGVGLSIRRGDDFFSGQRIMDEVWSSLVNSKLCIAECTGLNPNVFYELGIAHMLGIPTILIMREGHEIPFDIHDRRVIMYQEGEEGFRDLHQHLHKAVQTELLSHDDESRDTLE